MRNDSKQENQHYVPKMLLRNFGFKKRGRGESQVFVYDKHEDRQFSTSVRNIASERGFYEADFAGEKISIEGPLSELETRTQSAFSKLIELEDLSKLSENDFVWISLFIASQSVRGKNFRDDVKRINAGIVAKFGPHISGVDEQLPTDEEGLKLFSMRFLMENTEEFSQTLMKKVWVLMKAPTSKKFYLSDNPVVLHNDRKSTDIFSNIGLEVPGIQIYLPLSPSLILALWCPELVQELSDGFANLQKQKERMYVLKTLGKTSSPEQLDSMIKELEAGSRRLEALLDGISGGLPMLCTDENAIFFNHLQVSHAHRFVISKMRDFALVREMIAANSDFRFGRRMSVL